MSSGKAVFSLRFECEFFFFNRKKANGWLLLKCTKHVINSTTIEYEANKGINEPVQARTHPKYGSFLDQ